MRTRPQSRTTNKKRKGREPENQTHKTQFWDQLGIEASMGKMAVRTAGQVANRADKATLWAAWETSDWNPLMVWVVTGIGDGTRQADGQHASSGGSVKDCVEGGEGTPLEACVEASDDWDRNTLKDGWEPRSWDGAITYVAAGGWQQEGWCWQQRRPWCRLGGRNNVGTPQKAQQVSAFKTETLILRLFVWNSWIQDCAHTLAETNQWTQAEMQVERDPWTRHVNGSQGAIACPLKVCVSLHGYVPDYHWPTAKPVMLDDVTASKTFFSTASPDTLVSVICAEGDLALICEKHWASLVN